MKELLQLTVNGEPREVYTVPWKTLLHVLRDELELTGGQRGVHHGELRDLHRLPRRQDGQELPDPDPPGPGQGGPYH